MMYPSLTVWTSRATEHIQSRVAHVLGVTRGDGSGYDAISVVGRSVAEMEERIGDAFNRLVKLNTIDPTLHILAVIPMFEVTSADQIRDIYEACSSSEHRVTLHILGLASGIRHLCKTSDGTTCEPIDIKPAQELVKSLCPKATFSISFTIIDDYAENGAHIGFSINSLARYISLIQSSLLQDYYNILPPGLLASHAGDTLSMGVASLSFNRDDIIRQMMGLGFTEALDNVGINDTKVNAQYAASEAGKILDRIERFYPDLYKESIEPLYKEKNLVDTEVAARASAILDDGIDVLKSRVLSLLNNDVYSLPEKESILALILGHDNKNLSGAQYDQSSTLLDDACREPMDLYIDAFNRCCRKSGLLPVRRKYEALKKYVWNGKRMESEESPENDKAFNPLDDIRRLKQEIINTTSFIRDRQLQLDNLQKSVRQRMDAEEITARWHRPSGVLRDVEYKEQPLDERYEPAKDLMVKNNVDMRGFFTPVGSQSNLGACTSFAAVAMYEAMMMRSGAATPPAMSPAYLYYYSNVLNGRPEGGSNFSEQFEVLGKQGVCSIELYDEYPPVSKPSEEADADARNHRLLSAKQIPLIDFPDKSETLKTNHRLLTSALSEGYPIGISLKIYDNFGKNGAFILHPDDNPDAKEEGRHAMVVVGYSEEDGFYIVRNSWGAEFGEDGYCYIPTSYIDDPTYMSFACIITEITANAESRAEIPTVIAQFAASETEIRMAAIRNAISRARVELNSGKRLYDEYYKYYQELILQLTKPKVQNKIRDEAEKTQAEFCGDLEKKKQQLDSGFVPKKKEYRDRLIRLILTLAIITVALGAGAFLGFSSWLGLACLVSAALLVLSMLGFAGWMMLKHHELEKEKARLYQQVVREEARLREMRIRYYVAGMWISKFHTLAQDIENVYIRLDSYNEALRNWQESYSSQIEPPARFDDQMFRVLVPTHLKDFFNQNKASILKSIDLIKVFEDYQVNPDKLDTYHRNLQDAVYDVIASLFAGFNMVDFLLGEKVPYLDPVDLSQEISTLINVGLPSFRNREMNATTPTYFLLDPSPRDSEKKWAAEIGRLFPLQPVRLRITDPTTLILITIHPQK